MKAQIAMNINMFWIFGFFNKYSNMTIYNILKEFSIPPITSFYAKAHI